MEGRRFEVRSTDWETPHCFWTPIRWSKSSNPDAHNHQNQKPQNSDVFHRFIAELDPLDITPDYLFLGIKKVLPQTRKDPANLGVNRVFSAFMSAWQSSLHQEVRNHPASGIRKWVISEINQTNTNFWSERSRFFWCATTLSAIARRMKSDALIR